MFEALSPYRISRPTAYYAALKATHAQTSNPVFLWGHAQILMKYATDLVKVYEKSGLQPDPHWYATKEYDAHQKPKTEAAPKAAPAAKGAKGGLMSKIRTVFRSLTISASGPMRPACILAGERKKKYEYDD